MVDAVRIAASVLALSVSAMTAWLTLFRRGTVMMTQPTVIFFGPDTPRSHEDVSSPKIYLRTLLFATSKRGRIVETMHVSVTRSEMRQNFNIWVHGDDKLVRGSGLFVSETGVAANHHFLTPKDGSSFEFSSGRYRLDVFAQLSAIESEFCCSPKILSWGATLRRSSRSLGQVFTSIGDLIHHATWRTLRSGRLHPIPSSSSNYWV